MYVTVNASYYTYNEFTSLKCVVLKKSATNIYESLLRPSNTSLYNPHNSVYRVQEPVVFIENGHIWSSRCA